MCSITTHDSQGRPHTVIFAQDDYFHVAACFLHDSVQVSHDGKFKIGDMVRPTKSFIDAVLQGSIPYECIAQWPKGYKIIEIGPKDLPYAGVHDIELEGFDVIGLTNETIEKV